MSNKRYYWLRLKDDFFTTKEIKIIRKMPSGSEILIVLLKLQIAALKTGGLIEIDGICDSVEEELSIIIDEDPKVIKLALIALAKFHLIANTKDSDIEVLLHDDAIGSESASTIRARKSRANKALQCNTNTVKIGNDNNNLPNLEDSQNSKNQTKNSQDNQNLENQNVDGAMDCDIKALQCNTSATPMQQNCSVETEKEKEKEKQLLTKNMENIDREAPDEKSSSVSCCPFSFDENKDSQVEDIEHEKDCLRYSLIQLHLSEDQANTVIANYPLDVVEEAIQATEQANLEKRIDTTPPRYLYGILKNHKRTA
ncbi:phage replisome organizer N-terminal domain-containing protein [Francisella philomiragia]|uniref:phage replisome organizer N-terminal domain-containing protein n=1 Tax=Francisella philomiragia TaxID=28110 RepID=UPI001C9DAC79|nr:phage replisome organizer N-terminal domain-containing protein [Francisella philomiragia]MBY7733463.1 phage replisome organizer N-terminal domain-containing protein [Francisella philomiragia]